MLNPTHLIQSGGLLLLALMVFAESGMMVGFFLPGDTLLLGAGVLAAAGKLSVAAAIIVAALAAIAGDNTGYQIGKTAGPKIFKKKSSLFFRHEYLMQSEKFFERYGAKTMLIVHFIPIARTFVPIVAGVGRMHRPKFAIFDAVGDTAWAVIVTMLGYWFGREVPNVDHYILPVFALAAAVSFGPMAYHLVKALFGRRSLTKTNKNSKSLGSD